MASSLLQSRKVEGKEDSSKYDSDVDDSSDDERAFVGKYATIRKR